MRIVTISREFGSGGREIGEKIAKELGYDYKLEGIDPPTQERIENANRILETAKYLK